MRATLPLLPRHGPGRQRFLVWIIGFMAYMAALAMVGAFMIGNAIEAWRATVDDMVTVVVPAPPTDARDPQRLIDSVLAVAGVGTVRALPDWELRTLLDPWLPQEARDGLPLPLVLEVVLGDASLDAVTAAIRRVEPGADVVAHRQPMADLVRMGSSIQAVGALIVVLVLAAACGTVVFTTRASLVIHHRMIDLVHMMGATDHHLARPFSERAMRLGLLGGLLGVAGAVITLVLVIGVVDTDVIGLSRAAMTGWQWLAVGAVPLVFAMIPMLTAHVTVLRTLSRLP
ncbi:MAG: hypothetical protein R3F55_21040 [Alphaproteobacteria bacterium]